jgi:hypothetical protein
MPASLAEMFPPKVYVIHEMLLADDFFIRRQHGRKCALLCASLAQNEGAEICGENRQRPLILLWIYGIQRRQLSTR